MNFLWKYFLRWIGFIKVVHRGRVIGMPNDDFEQVYYLWRWGNKYRRLVALFTPTVIYGTIKTPGNIRAAEICCDSTKRNTAAGAGETARAKQPDPAKKPDLHRPKAK